MGLSYVSDDDKIDAARNGVGLMEELHAAHPEVEFQLLPAITDAGTRYGWRRQAGDTHALAINGMRLEIEEWFGGPPVVDNRLRRHMGDDVKIELTNKAVPIIQGGEKTDLYAALFDAGCQFGQYVQDTTSITGAFAYVGRWLAQYYGQNPWAPQPGTHPNPVEGDITSDGLSFLDGHGNPRNLVTLHAGDYFAVWASGDDGRAAIEAEMDKARDAGYHALRAWIFLNDMLNPSEYWANQPVPRRYYVGWGPNATPDYQEKVIGFAQALKARQLMWVADHAGSKGMARSAQETAYQCLKRAMDAAGSDAFFAVGGGNECRDTVDSRDQDPAWQEHLISYCRDAYPNKLYYLSAYTGGDGANVDNLRRYTMGSQRFVYWHGFRDFGLENKIEHRSCGALTYDDGRWRDQAFDGESCGPNGNQIVAGNKLTQVTAQGNPQQLQNDEAMGCIAAANFVGNAISNYMCDAGVQWVGKSPSEFPGYYAQPALARVLPQDMSRYVFPDERRSMHGGDRWKGRTIFAAKGTGGASELRADARVHPDGRSVTLVYTMGRRPWSGELPRYRDISGSTVIHPGTGEQADGGRAPRVDGMQWGRVVVTPAR